jgi:uncharacterized phage protein gp47/JayE
MPWTTPTLKAVRTLTRDFVTAQLGAAALIPNSVLRIMSDAKSGLAHLVLLYIDWLAKQLLPDTAETEWLDRHGNIWLTNADGSKGRKSATFASGTGSITGATPLLTIASGSLVNGPNGVLYQTTADAIIDGTGNTTVAMVALTAGIIGNVAAGDRLGLASPVAGIPSSITVLSMDGGTDEERDDDLLIRVLLRIQKPPMGGDFDDYKLWTLAVAGVTRAFPAPLEMGMGTVTVRFLMDNLRADNHGIPTADDIAKVRAYLDTVRAFHRHADGARGDPHRHQGDGKAARRAGRHDVSLVGR